MRDTPQPSLFGDTCAGPCQAPSRRARALVVPGVREIALTYRSRPDLRNAPTRITNSGDAATLCDWLRDLPHEEAWVIALNAVNDVLGVYQVGRGGLTEAPVAPSEIYRTALLASAAAVLMVHNHPSGRGTPSAEDRRLTQRLVAAGELLAVPLLDHVILGLRDHYSFADQGFISEYRSAETRRAR
ncbi:MAG: JAB domain-containing protein [Candidatus Methylomirabilota bacterium]